MGKRRGKRAWELRRLDREKEETNGIQWNDDDDMGAVCRDLEEDPELRQKVNMYRTADLAPQTSVANVSGEQADEDEDEDEDAPEVPLAELLEGLELKDD